MSVAESDLLPLSALQHLLFCPRQCALIHVERLWEENRWTAEGRVLHKKAHEGKPETRDGERITRGLPLRSFRLGLFGVADIVLWRPPPDRRVRGRTLRQAILAAKPEELAEWSVIPVEYKRGKPKQNDCDRVQLCAQAICLEEMLGIEVQNGQLYYGTNRRRVDVALDADLREVTADAASRLHAMIASGVTPPGQYEKKCDTCSLLSVCLPAIGTVPSAERYVSRLVSSLANEAE
jgi:CRISPR-associated exonuclease Cas4